MKSIATIGIVDWTSVTIELLPADYRALSELASSPERHSRRQQYWFLRMVLWAVMLLVSLRFPWAWLIVAAELLVVLAEARERRTSHRSQLLDLLGGRYEASARGLTKSSEFGESRLVWTAVDRISVSGDHLLVRFAGTGWLLPFRCFTSEEHRRKFITTVQEHVDWSRGKSPIDTRLSGELRDPSGTNPVE